MKLRNWMSVPLALGLLVSLSVFAEEKSELDAKAVKSPSIVMKKLDPKTQIVTTYKVDKLDDSVKPEAMEKLTKEEQKSKMEAFIRSVESNPANKISEEKVEKVALASTEKSELEKAGSTSAHGWRWRGNYGCGYGGGYYGGYYNNNYYQPYYGYNYNRGYYNYGGYNNYGYNNYAGYGYGNYGYYNNGYCNNNYVDVSFYSYNNNCGGYGW